MVRYDGMVAHDGMVSQQKNSLGEEIHQLVKRSLEVNNHYFQWAMPTVQVWDCDKLPQKAI